MIEPLRLRFQVACPAEHAFDIWTRRISLWWPADHTVTQRADATVTFEPAAGGRIFERIPTGQEYDWGWITAWEPPARLVYQWHLGSAPHQATEVEVTFAEGPDGTTQVDIEHRGWEALEPEALEPEPEPGGEERRRRNQAGWAGVVPLFTAACDTQKATPGPGP